MFQRYVSGRVCFREGMFQGGYVHMIPWNYRSNMFQRFALLFLAHLRLALFP